MSLIREFLNQKAPKSGAEMPAYFRRALLTSERIMAAYFLLNFLMIRWVAGRWTAMPALAFAAIALCAVFIDKMHPRLSSTLHSAVTLVWSAWHVCAFGWIAGGNYLVLTLLVLAFFNVFNPPWLKLSWFVGLLVSLAALYTYSEAHAALFTADRGVVNILQTLNGVTLFVILAVLCVIFSSATQATERQLRIDNQALHREAGTDPLTQLPNRRAMLDEMELFCRNSPSSVFSVAIADIDFFKNVNDTYGHNCGDYTLKTLAALFREAAGAKYKVCRWGGEEFCFFMPEMNLDVAGQEMIDLNAAVSHMPLSFEGNDFSINITIGVEENDFRSPMEAIIEKADQKLYIGKNNGRNRVVI